MAVQNLPKSESELLNTVGVDDGIDGGVGVREDDGDVHDEAGLLQLAVEESEAVQDVHGQPAESEQAHDDGERFSGTNLSLQQAVVLILTVTHAAFELDLTQLFPCHREDLDVNAQHDEQRWQHTTEEVEVDHVAHVHHFLKEALEAAALQEARFHLSDVTAVASLCEAAFVSGTGQVFTVPAHEWDESNDEG